MPPMDGHRRPSEGEHENEDDDSGQGNGPLPPIYFLLLGGRRRLTLVVVVTTEREYHCLVICLGVADTTLELGTHGRFDVVQTDVRVDGGEWLSRRRSLGKLLGCTELGPGGHNQ